MKSIALVVVATLISGTANAAVPLFAAKCSTNITVDSNTKGQVYVNGAVAKLINRPDGQITAQSAGIYIDITPRGAQPPQVTYTAKDKSIGMCNVVSFKAPGNGSSVNSAGTAQSGRGQPIAPGDMLAYCRGEAAGQFQTKPFYIKTGKLTRTQGGGYAVKGSADLGDQGEKPFECEYDKQGRFLRFSSLVDEGKM